MIPPLILRFQLIFLNCLDSLSEDSQTKPASGIDLSAAQSSAPALRDRNVRKFNVGVEDDLAIEFYWPNRLKTVNRLRMVRFAGSKDKVLGTPIYDDGLAKPLYLPSSHNPDD
jgi:hypothetical protein